MDRRLVVSTECPTCGAPLDFKEGSNAVRCQYCRSNLLITGRKHVLSYYVKPKVHPHNVLTQYWLNHIAQDTLALKDEAEAFETERLERLQDVASQPVDAAAS